MIFDILNALMGILLFFLQFIVVVSFFLWWVQRDKIQEAGGIRPYLEKMKIQGAQMAKERPQIIPQTMRPGAALGGMALFLVLAVAMMAGGIYFQEKIFTESRLLQSEGVKTWATVVEKMVYEHSDSNDTYHLRYSWILADGQETRREAESQVPGDVFVAVEEGQLIEIIYARSRPEIVKVTADYRPDEQNFWPIGIGLGVGIVFLLVAVFYLDALRKGLRLQAAGNEIWVPLIDSYVDSSDGKEYYVVYESPQSGKVGTQVSKKHYERATVGTMVSLRYLPETPQIFWLSW